MQRELSDEQKAKLRRLGEDFQFFAQVALKIKGKDGKVVPFVLNRAQKYIHDRIEDQLKRTGMVRAIILKGRQQGASTYTEGRFYWRSSRTRGLTSYILTHEDKATANLFRMVRNYHDLMPPALRPSTGAANANELVFDVLGSRYAVGTAQSKATGRSSTIQLFHGSEVAFWTGAEDHMAGVGQAVPMMPGTEVILESTANGVGNVFYGLVHDALAGKGAYELIFVPWMWQPEYAVAVDEHFALSPDEAEYASLYGCSLEQMAWRRMKIVDDFRNDATMFDQEYPATVALAFRRAAKEPYIPLTMVERAMRTQLEDPPAHVPDVLGLDPAEYGDDDAVMVWRRGRKVMRVWRWSKRGTMELVGLVARVIADLEMGETAWEWPDALNVDCTGIGSGVADRLSELGFRVNRVHFGESAERDDIYVRRGDECWGEMKSWLEDIPCAIPSDETTKIDLSGRSYGYDSSRRLVMESKDKMKARGLRSPDAGDAIALTHAVAITSKAPRPGAPGAWGHARQPGAQPASNAGY